MKDLKHDLGLWIVKLVDVLLVTIPFAMCWYMYYAVRIDTPFQWKGNALIVFLFVVLFFVYGRIYDAFHVSLNRISEMIYSVDGISLFGTRFLTAVLTKSSNTF